MSKNLLKIGSENQLVVEARSLKRFDVAYNFDKGQLEHKVLDTEQQFSTYILSGQLVNAVNAALLTGRPLLIQGEPGSGKTKLAQAVAVHFHQNDANRFYFEWSIKSKSAARDGAYIFDHVSRLRDATISQIDKVARIRVSKPQDYVRLGPLGKAFQTQPENGFPSILLIDEIDKGDLDFPNDLLLELDEMRFQIYELKDFFISADEKKRPLIIITSNEEKELPPAFLRRCLIFTIPELSSDLLLQIAKSKLNEYYSEFSIISPDNKLDDERLKEVINKFVSIKEDATVRKTPSTSELLDWLKLLTFKVYNDGEKVETFINDNAFQSLALKLL